MHISKAFLLITTALTLATALPSTHTTNSDTPKQNLDRALAREIREQEIHERRLAAFAAQKPLHTAALLAGAAAATPTAQKRHNNLRVRDLRTVTGEDGLWVSLEDIVAREADDRPPLDEVDDEEEDVDDEAQVYTKKVEQQILFIERREGWDTRGKRKGKGKGNGAGEI